MMHLGEDDSARMLGYGVGALYQAPDGALYQVPGFGEADQLVGLGEDELTRVMGIGFSGEVRQGPDGNLYQWTEGYDGLGNPIGFWAALPAIAKAALPFIARAAPRLAPYVSRALPFLRTARRIWRAPGRRIVRQLIPALAPLAPVMAPMPAAVPAAEGENEEGDDLGLGALYQAPDGTVYQVQGFAEDMLPGVGEDDLVGGLEEDDQLAEDDLLGVGEDDLVGGLEEDDQLAEDDLLGVGEDDLVGGLEAYTPEEGVMGLEEAYVREEPPRMRWFSPPAQSPEMWKPLW
jgi:hypothetical protein